MSLITKTVKVKWGARNKRHFENLGYVYTKIGDEFEVKVEDLSKGCDVRVKCKCDNCGSELDWVYKEYNKSVKEDGATYCNKCAVNLFAINKSNKTKLKNSKSFEEWCIENNKLDILDRWDFELNDCKPSEILYGSNKKYWFKCDKHSEHKSELKRINPIVKCGYIQCNQCDSIAQYLLDTFPNKNLEQIWDYEKNKSLNPWDIMHGSRIKIWIKCQEKDYHESYEISCNNFLKGERCPYCTGKKVHPVDSLGQYIIDIYNEDILNKIWSNRNEKSAFEYAPYSNKKVWLKCLDGKHDDYLRKCCDIIYKECRCPKCVRERKESIIEEKTKIYINSLGYTILHECDCTIKPKNPKTKMSLPYDNEIILDNGEHLIIEVHGKQHYKADFYRLKGFEEKSEQQLHYQQVKDRYKRIYAIQNGYHYLEIPYTAFNKQETYKNLIDDKIKQIKNNQQEESA